MLVKAAILVFSDLFFLELPFGLLFGFLRILKEIGVVT